ncbi:MAG: OmpA family protein [Rhodospirillales bacterium]
MKFIKFTLAIALLPFLAACAVGPDIAATKAMPNKGSAFHMALQNEYIALAQAEADEWDTDDAIYFNNKAIAAAKGEDVKPQPIKERNIKGAAADEIEAAYIGLRGELLSGAKDWAPMEAAKAQAMYDCWLQEKEEDDQQKHIDDCRNAFNAAMDKINGMRPRPMASAPAAPKMMPLPSPYTVYFDFDSFELSATGAAVIKEAAKAGLDAGAKGVTITGHTDKSGSDEYNAGLSRARAASVSNQMMAEGVARGMIKRVYSGEADPEVATKDGTKEARNRRVTIAFTK